MKNQASIENKKGLEYGFYLMRYKIRKVISKNGNIKIEVAEEVGLEAEIETSLGSIHFDETVFEVIRHTKDLAERSALIRKTRNLMTRVVAETTTGNIQVNQLQSDSSSKKEG